MADRINGRTIRTAWPILDARTIGDRTIVLFDPDAQQKNSGQFPNLVAFDMDGNQIWTAELPTTMSGDRYYRIESEHPLKVLSIKSFSCELDVDSGRIVGNEFYK